MITNSFSYVTISVGFETSYSNGKYTLVKVYEKRMRIGKQSVYNSYKTILDWLFEGDDIKPTCLYGMTSTVFSEMFNANKLAYIILKPDSLPKRESARDQVPLDVYLNNAECVSHAGSSFTQVKYKQSACKIGRVYGNNSGQGMLREARYVIFDGIYNDFDLKNAHPVLLSQLLTALEINHPHLRNYIDNRDACLKTMIDIGLTRDEAKRKYIMAIYGAGDKSLTETACSEEFLDYVREMRGISEFMRERFCSIAKRIEIHKSKQHGRGGRPATTASPLDGSVLSFICQHMEVNVLALMYKCLKTLNKKASTECILQHDGIMIPKSVDHESWIDLCYSTFKQHGFSAQIELKPFDNIELKGFDQEVNYIEELCLSSSTLVRATNSFDMDDEYCFHHFLHGVASIPNSLRVAENTLQYIAANFDRVCKIVGANTYYIRDNKTTVSCETGIPSFFSHFYVWSKTDNGVCHIPFNNFFIKNIKMFSRLDDVNPLWNDTSNQRLLQLKPGFAADPHGLHDKDKLAIFKKHTLEVICAGDMNSYIFLMQWLAHVFYKPNIKSQKIVIISGGQGSGKSLWFNIISRSLFGSQVCLENIGGLQALLDKDNYRFLNKKLLCVNELIQWDGNVSSQLGRLKDFITEDEISVKKMYCNVRVEKAYYELIGLSNHDDVIRLEQSDRRFFMLKTCDSYIGDTEYFKALHSCMSCPEFGNALAYELKSHIVDGFEQIRPPMTAIKRDVLEISSGYVREFTQAVIEAGENGLYHYAPDSDGWYVSLRELYNMYCHKNEYPSRNWNGVRKSLERLGWAFMRTSAARLSKPPAYHK